MLWSSGGNFLDVLPAPDVTRAALARTPLRVHQDILVTHQMFVEPGETVVLLPAATRYEQEGGGTSTTTERRVAFSPEIPGPARRRGAQRMADLRRRRAPRPARPRRRSSGARRPTRSAPRSRASCRATRASRRCATTGDAIQVGGARLCEGGRVPDARRQGALRGASRRTRVDVPEGRFVLSTRRGKQFNSMVWAEQRPAHRRRAATRCSSPDADAAALGVAEGDPVLVRSAHGELRARVHLAPIRPGNVQAFFPEANPLLSPTVREPLSGVPDYNAVVEVVPVR